MFASCARRARDFHTVTIDLEREGALGLVGGRIGGILCDDGEGVVAIRCGLAAEDAGGVVQIKTDWKRAAGFE